MKRCSRCKIVKTEDEFRRDRLKEDGLYDECKKCESTDGGGGIAAT